MENVYRYIVENVSAGKIEKSIALEMIKLMKQEEKGSGDIAIIGISAKIPMAEGLDEYWDNINLGIECVDRFQPSRADDITAFLKYKGMPDEDIGYYEGAYLSDIDKFDCGFFKCTPKEAQLMDPNQRLFMETVFKAIGDAGYCKKTVSGTKTGIYVGFAENIRDMYSRILFDSNSMEAVSIVGNIAAIMPARISYMMNLKGPCVVIDSACSSSMTALVTACQAIRKGDCEMAIAGGVKINLVPLDRESDKLGIESKDGRTRTLDENADGAGIGEGVFAILLKPLKRALEDRDNIYAVIKGIGINQDGASSGITAPNPESQAEVLIKAWEDAGINPETLSYIEMHGTATYLGDTIEFKGIRDAFKKFTDKRHICAVSTVKSNMGHLYEASGMAGIIKAVLALKNKVIPAGIHFDRPNTSIDFCNSPVFVNTVSRKWETTGQPRRCGVSSFGISGTNCHVVLEEAPEVEDTKDSGNSPHALTLSAVSEKVLVRLAGEYLEFLDKRRSLLPEDVCYTAGTGRNHYNYRLALTGFSLDDLICKLRTAVREGLSSEQIHYGYHRTAGKGNESGTENVISESDKKILTEKASLKIAEFINNGGKDMELLDEICILYAKGAEIDWMALYKNNETKVSLPVYSFEKNRCWVEIPDTLNNAFENNVMYYTLGWKREDRNETAGVKHDGTVLIIEGTGEEGKMLAQRMRKEGRNVAEVQIEDIFKGTLKDNNSALAVEEYFDNLLSRIEGDISQVIHAASINNLRCIETLEELTEYRNKCFYSLMYFVRSMLRKGMDNEVDIVLLSRFANSVTGSEETLKPENAILFGLGKAIRRETPQFRCRFIDFDNNFNIDDILKELSYNGEIYCSSYRNGERYVEEFREADIENAAYIDLKIKSDGVYVITGGTGGIGIEIARHLAENKGIHLALIGRKELQSRENWDEILRIGEDRDTCKRISEIMSVEKAGAFVEYFKADVSDMTEVEPVLDILRGKYGRINGIIHGAGVGIAEEIQHKSFEDFGKVLDPKVNGTWIMDILTREDDLDFFVMFSSVATVFSAPEQSDYTAANAYLDTYVSFMRKMGRKALAINWSTWKETGMAARNGINVDTIMKAMDTESAVKSFDELLRRDAGRVLVGRINFGSGFASLIEGYPFRLSESIKNKLEKTKVGSRNYIKPVKEGFTGSITLKGRENETYTEIEKKIGNICRDVLGFNEISIYDNFFELGADSILLTKMQKKLEKIYPGKISVTDFFSHTTIARLAKFISGDSDFKGFEETKNYNELLNFDDRIAVIGMALKLPNAETADEFWDNMVYGVDSITELQGIRKNDTQKYLNYINIPADGLKYCEYAFLERIDEFDYSFFRISPKEAGLMDPNQRMFLETAWKAVEDAGYGGGKLVGSNTGVYAGFSNNIRDMYSKILFDVDPSSLSQSAVGNLAAVTTGRISYLMDLKGPSMVVDTACSSSLVAVSLACQAIRNGQCDMAIAGGIRTSALPVENDNMKLGIESSDGRTRAFDEESDGSGIGEGIAAVILKPLKKAVEDRDNIYSVIIGASVNQDGNSAGITAPNPAAQSEVISNAWKDAGIDPETVSYIETHGTGTKLGDPIEIMGIQGAFRKFTKKNQFCAVSSVKTNIGHLSEAAGVVSLIKAAMALKKKKIPPSKYFNRPNLKVDFADSPVYINTRLKDWNCGNNPRRCGVSAFGISGTNCHIVMEEAPAGVLDKIKNDSTLPYAFVLSARDEDVLYQMIENYDKYLDGTEESLRDICATACTGRGHCSHRIAVIANDINELRERIKKIRNEGYGRLLMPWFCYGKHTVMPQGKEFREEDEITELEKSGLKQKADILISGYTSSGFKNTDILTEICSLYVKGSDVDWSLLYPGEKVKKVSLPTYSFKKTRCWLDIPEVSIFNQNQLEKPGMHYETVWVREEGITGKTPVRPGPVLVFRDDRGIASGLIDKFKEEGREVIEVSKGDGFEALSGSRYTVSGMESDYEKLISEIKDRRPSMIVHLFSISDKAGILSLEDFEQNQKWGIYSLFYLIRAIVKNSISYDMDIVLISEYVNEVSGNESSLHPENSTFMGFGKVVEQEYSNLKVRAIDIDGVCSAGDIICEIKNDYKYYICAYREGVRYIEEFRQAQIESFGELKTEIKEDGAYLITGGTGGIGLEVAKYLSKGQKANIVLVGKTKMPEREEWDGIIEANENSKLIKRIMAVRELESRGSTVELYNSDTSDMENMKYIIEDVKRRFGKINGVIHAAGIAGAGYIVRKDENNLRSVLDPKVKGAWILDCLTSSDRLDFFIVFASAITIVGEAGQCDYVAANTFLDSFSSYRNRQGKRTIAIDWVAWKSAGMSVDFGINVDAIFKVLPTPDAIDSFEKILNRNVKRIIVGELNLGSRYTSIIKSFPLRISRNILELIDKYEVFSLNNISSGDENIAIMENGKVRLLPKGKKSAKAKDGRSHDVKLKGRDRESYTKIEEEIAGIYCDVLGFEEISIYDSFFEIGGDSLLLGRVYEKLDSLYPGMVKIVELFEYTSVSRLANFIMSRTAYDEAACSSENKEIEEYKDIFDELSKGTLSIEDVLEKL